MKNKLLMELIHEIKNRFQNINVGINNIEKTTWLVFKQCNKEMGSVFFDIIDSYIVSSLYWCKSDKKIEIIIKNQTDIDKLISVLDSQFQAYNNYYKTIQDNPDSICERFNFVNNQIKSKIDLTNLKIENTYTTIDCWMGKIENIKTNKVIFFRFNYSPLGYIATIIRSTPFDEQIDYDMDTEINNFIVDLTCNIM